MSPEHFPERFNMAGYFLDRNVEAGRGDKPCLYWRDQAFTYREVQARANRCANALRALGLRIEDRVLLVLEDRPEFAFAWFGAAKAGGVIAMVNPHLPAADYRHYFDYTRARVAIVDAVALPRLDALRDELRHLEHLLLVGGDPGRHLSFEDLCARASERCLNADTHRDDPAIWLFTSGSTGQPQEIPNSVLDARLECATVPVPELQKLFQLEPKSQWFGTVSTSTRIQGSLSNGYSFEGSTHFSDLGTKRGTIESPRVKGDIQHKFSYHFATNTLKLDQFQLQSPNSVISLAGNVQFQNGEALLDLALKSSKTSFDDLLALASVFGQGPPNGVQAGGYGQTTMEIKATPMTLTLKRRGAPAWRCTGAACGSAPAVWCRRASGAGR